MPRGAVLGKPVSHSLSPVLHRAAYAALGLADWTYDAIECDEAGLGALLAESGPDVAGYSCTMPLKREVLVAAHSRSEHALAIGAGNTLLQIDGLWHADNTDWIGIRAALAEGGVHAPERVLILGAGGTAQAALAAVGPDAHVRVLVRNLGRTEELLATADRLEQDVVISALEEFPLHLADTDVVISTLPAGAADALVAGAHWEVGQVLLDAVYVPWPTVLAGAAADKGATVCSGALMLLHQAVRQVELMTGHPVAGTSVERAMREALRTKAPASGL